MRLVRIAQHILGTQAWLRTAPASTGHGSILDQYTHSAPDPQATVDIFRGEWWSAFPEPLSAVKAGPVELFHDARVTWFAESIGGVSGKSVLELGPLEGGHSYMLEKLGAERITAIESNTRAFLKCLVAKELLQITRVRFLFGDFLEYLGKNLETFDVCMASGVLYHMQHPVELIALLSECCRGHLCLWTHHFDPAVIRANPKLSSRFTRSSPETFEGFHHTLHRQEYQAALNSQRHCGGNAPISHWLSRGDIFRCLDYFGFEVEGVAFDEPDHQNGPALALVARRIMGKGPRALHEDAT
jgi:hypothetical protein